MINLRPYQSDLIRRTRAALMRSRSAMVVLGCGGGKSVIAGSIAKMTTDNGKRVLFIVHRRELCQQIEHTFRECGVNMKLCSIAMVQTISRHPEKIAMPALIIIDEAHHVMARGYRKVLDACADAYRIGFTATPDRLDGQNISEIFTERVEGPSVSWLIEHNFLAGYTAYNFPGFNSDELRMRAGEFRTEDVNNAMAKFQYGEAVKQWLKLANGKKTIVYNHSVEAAKITASKYCEAGIKAAELDGNTPQAEREQIVQAFRDGEITVLTNVDLFGEGFDVPDCECVQLLRPTASFTVFVQQSMRSMRYREGKHALILDHTENIKRFGVPTAWKKRKNKAVYPTIKTCPECFHVYEVKSPQEAGQPCPQCGFKPEKVAGEEAGERDERKPAVTLDVDLRAVGADGGIPDFSKVITLEECKTFEDLVRYQKQQGYKFGWVIYRAKAMKIKIPGKYYGYMYKRGMMKI